MRQEWSRVRFQDARTVIIKLLDCGHRSNTSLPGHCNSTGRVVEDRLELLGLHYFIRDQQQHGNEKRKSLTR
jgi:hypothetical protein